MTKFFTLALAGLLIAGTLGACQNTFHGAGEDIENAGEGIQKSVPPKH